MPSDIEFDGDFLDASWPTLEEWEEQNKKKELPPMREKPICVCGAGSCGIKPYAHGHSPWCKVHEDRTPVY